MNTDRIFLAKKLQELKDAGIPAVAVGGNHDTLNLSGGMKRLLRDIIDTTPKPGSLSGPKVGE